jgi:hypothetical protein
MGAALETRVDKLEAQSAGALIIAVRNLGGSWDISDGPRDLTDAAKDAYCAQHGCSGPVIHVRVGYDAGENLI